MITLKDDTHDTRDANFYISKHNYCTEIEDKYNEIFMQTFIFL